ncbi:ARF-binding protein [Coemansia sp. RSA 2399]|nr:ARF-binding protein [Coemansia sp. RSA 2399]KAJ1907477.1 ARF-binding protein [Coemansia sp. IMI 209127]
MSFNIHAALDEMFKPASKLQTMIDQAVGSERASPDLVLNLDICELVNQKKGNFPHDAVFALMPYINGRSKNQALRALTLLDNLVKNGGHSVHYQVASREFLNDLFRRFPEYQPSISNPVHQRILEMLQEWRGTLCRHSRYKDDLQRINDMYSLLRRKGWRFPEAEDENVAVILGPKDSLRSREELEKEDLEAMQAKLQELLRRATPRDLREANKLMKVITGYEQSPQKPDYEREWDEELKGIEQKAGLLAEIVQNATPGTRLDETARDLFNKCTSAQLRLHKLISEQETDDGEDSAENQDVARLIRLNDYIIDVVQAFKDVEHGKTPEIKNTLDNAVSTGAAAASSTGAGHASGVGENELIVWDDEGEDGDGNSERENAQRSTPLSPLDDLVGLDFKDPTTNGPISLSAGSSAAGSQILNSPGFSAPLSRATGASSSTSLSAQHQLMSNPSLPANVHQVRMNMASTKDKDAFDFSDLLSAAKSASRMSASQPKSDSSGSPGTVTSGGASQSKTSPSPTSSEPSKPKDTTTTTDSLIDLL